MNSKILLIAVLCSQLLLAKTKEKEQVVDTKTSMNSFLEEFIGLKKFLVSDEKFKDPNNALSIQTHLQRFSEAVKKTRHNPVLTQGNFKFSRFVLEDHITDIERVFRVGNKSYARWMVNSTLNICMSCHTQQPTSSKRFSEFLNPKDFESDFDKAEFLFAVKDFKKANSLYQDLIQNYVDASLSGEKLETAVRRQVAYFARVNRDFTEGQEVLKKFLTNKNLPEFIKLNLAAWEEQFKKWSRIPLPNVKKSSPEEIIQFAEKNLSIDGPRSELPASDPKLITNLIASGILFEYLGLNPNSTKTPDILYWLAVSDRETNYTFYYSLADLYLRECIVQYSENPIAKKCYKEYETNTILGYTGSIGTNVPADVSKDLKRLKEMVNKNEVFKNKKASP
jgi:hypothetical protein